MLYNVVKKELKELVSKYKKLKCLPHLFGCYIYKNEQLMSKILKYTSFLDDNVKLSERVYCIMNDIKKIPICKYKYCNKQVKFIRVSRGYTTACCRSHAYKDVIISEERKEHLRQMYLGKTYEELHGEEKAKEIKRKHRLKRIEQITKNEGKFTPIYNKKAVKFFEYFDYLIDSKGKYAESGSGEYEILGYFLDYINFNYKLIIEFDEERHFTKKGLKKSDIQRQKEIQEYLFDFKFIRIREKNFIINKKLNYEKIIDYIKGEI